MRWYRFPEEKLLDALTEKDRELERLRNLYDQADLARAQLELRVTRLRKAVVWLRGAFHDEVCNFADPERPLPLDKCDTWECQRARAVLEEEAE
jgi:hypothetical protein